MKEYRACIKTHEGGDFRTLKGPSMAPLYSLVEMKEGVNWAWAGVIPPKAPSRRVPDTRPCEVCWYSPAYDMVSDDVINVNRGEERDVFHDGCAWGWMQDA
jgi:hypothetical protein